MRRTSYSPPIYSLLLFALPISLAVPVLRGQYGAAAPSLHHQEALHSSQSTLPQEQLCPYQNQYGSLSGQDGSSGGYADWQTSSSYVNDDHSLSNHVIDSSNTFPQHNWQVHQQGLPNYAHHQLHESQLPALYSHSNEDLYYDGLYQHTYDNTYHEQNRWRGTHYSQEQDLQSHVAPTLDVEKFKQVQKHLLHDSFDDSDDDDDEFNDLSPLAHLWQSHDSSSNSHSNSTGFWTDLLTQSQQLARQEGDGPAQAIHPGILDHSPSQEEEVAADTSSRRPRRGKARKKQSASDYQPGIPYASWQRQISPGDLELVYQRIRQRWPQDMDMDTTQKCDHILGLILKKDNDVVSRILNNDEKTIKEVAYLSSPELVLQSMEEHGERARQSGKSISLRYDGRHLHTGTWHVGEMTDSSKRRIYERLGIQWERSPPSVRARLTKYAKITGKMTSPDALLSLNDAVFEAAVAAIDLRTSKDAKYDVVDLPVDDILHRPYSQTVFEPGSGGEVPFTFPDPLPHYPYETKGTRIYAKRYRTHEWQEDYTYDEIDAIHRAVAEEWRITLDGTTVNRNMLKINDYLEQHPLYIKPILQGDPTATYVVAYKSSGAIKNMKREPLPEEVPLLV